jgi:excisionase family DNA binding protein
MSLQVWPSFERRATSEALNPENELHTTQLTANQRDSVFSPTPAITFEPLLNTEEAAKLLQIHPKTLERWAREARVPAYDLGRWKFRASELDAWLRRSVQSASANSAA